MIHNSDSQDKLRLEAKKQECVECSIKLPEDICSKSPTPVKLPYQGENMSTDMMKLNSHSCFFKGGRGTFDAQLCKKGRVVIGQERIFDDTGFEDLSDVTTRQESNSHPKQKNLAYFMKDPRKNTGY